MEFFHRASQSSNICGTAGTGSSACAELHHHTSPLAVLKPKLTERPTGFRGHSGALCGRLSCAVQHSTTQAEVLEISKGTDWIESVSGRDAPVRFPPLIIDKWITTTVTVATLRPSPVAVEGLCPSSAGQQGALPVGAHCSISLLGLRNWVWGL